VCHSSPARSCRGLAVVSVVVVLFLAGCRGDDSGRVPVSATITTLATSPGSGVAGVSTSAVDVAGVARGRLRLSSPGLGVYPVGDVVVGVPVWLWVLSWSRVWVTASVGGVSVTVIARPVSVLWAMGDGSVVECSGPGTPFRGMRDVMDGSPDCGYVYSRSSVGQVGSVFVLRATVRWSVSWVDGAALRLLPELTTSGTRQVRVLESRVRVRPGRRPLRRRSLGRAAR